MQFSEFMSKNWQKIIIILLVIMFFGTCGSNCSNKNKLRKYTKEIQMVDSIKNTLNDSIVVLNGDIKELKHENERLKGTIDLLNKSIGDLNNALHRNVVVNIKQEEHHEE